jgi:hypothetical protein
LLLTGSTSPAFRVHEYDTPYRYDWTFIVDEDWPIDTATSMLIWQSLPVTDPGTWSGPNMQLHVQNGTFKFTYAWADGSPPTPTSATLDLFPAVQGEYNMSIRAQNHLTNGKIEIWRDETLVASAYNVGNALTVGNYFIKYGIYRWLTFTGSISIQHSLMRVTSDFEFLA